MSDITVTAAQIAPVFPQKAEIYDLFAAAAITAGQIVYTTTAGKADLADASAAGTIVNPASRSTPPPPVKPSACSSAATSPDSRSPA